MKLAYIDKKELWLRLHNYHFNDLVPPNLWDKVTAKFGGADASTKAFAHKLAIKLGWKDNFAQWAVTEYKRFVYLGVISDFVVTPSDIIDQVWHQHILFSKAYRSFCTDVIEYDFDHTPELIASGKQTGTFSAQYFDTLELYKKEFGVDAPVAIWGRPKFDEQALVMTGYRSKKKETVVSSDGGGNSYSDVALYQSFDTNGGESFSDFGGGDSGGAGAGGSWDASDTSTDSSSSDSGSSCSSCSSGCGGGD